MRRVVLSAVCLRGIAGSKTAGGIDVSLSLVIIVYALR